MVNRQILDWNIVWRISNSLRHVGGHVMAQSAVTDSIINTEHRDSTSVSDTIQTVYG